MSDMGTSCGVTAFSTPIGMLINAYRSYENFNCMDLRQACKGTPSRVLPSHYLDKAG